MLGTGGCQNLSPLEAEDRIFCIDEGPEEVEKKWKGLLRNEEEEEGEMINPYL